MPSFIGKEIISPSNLDYLDNSYNFDEYLASPRNAESNSNELSTC